MGGIYILKLPVITSRSLLQLAGRLQLEELGDVVQEGEDDDADQVGQALALAHLNTQGWRQYSTLPRQIQIGSFFDIGTRDQGVPIYIQIDPEDPVFYHIARI